LAALPFVYALGAAQVPRHGYAGELDCEFVAVWAVDESHDSLKKWFVYQSTEIHDELKMSDFQWVGRSEGRMVQTAGGGPGAV